MKGNHRTSQTQDCSGDSAERKPSLMPTRIFIIIMVWVLIIIIIMYIMLRKAIYLAKYFTNLVRGIDISLHVLEQISNSVSTAIDGCLMKWCSQGLHIRDEYE